MKLTGAIPPLLTPATDDGLDVHPERLRKLTRWFIDSGVGGLFIAATTGEAAMLSRRQRQVAVETVVAEAKGRVPVLAGASAPSTSGCLELAGDAQDAGADFVVLLAPGLVPLGTPLLTEDELYGHFARICDSISIPAVLYNYPAIVFGNQISPKLLGNLCAKSNVVGIKDSSGDLTNTRKFREACGSDISLLTGADQLVYAHLCLGGDGMICSGMNAAPKGYVSIFETYRRGELDRSLACQDAITPLRSLVAEGTFPAGYKSAIRRYGLDAGPPFLPAKPLSDGQAQRAAAILAGVVEAQSRLGIEEVAY